MGACPDVLVTMTGEGIGKEHHGPHAQDLKLLRESFVELLECVSGAECRAGPHNNCSCRIPCAGPRQWPRMLPQVLLLNRMPPPLPVAAKRWKSWLSVVTQFLKHLGDTASC